MASDDGVERFHGETLWKYARLLPADKQYASPLQVGGTPLYDFGIQSGIHLYVKDESRNPSGSLKDRASELVLAVARENGIDHVVTASTGNAAASLACLAASQRMNATIFVPQNAPTAKLAQVKAFGATVVTVDGDYDMAYHRASEFAARTGAYCRNTGANPFTREGKKTVAFEIAEQLGWQSPDWIFVPTGDGNILSSVAKGFIELRALGLVKRLPRLACVQARSSNAISLGLQAARLNAGLFQPVPIVSPKTCADSIAVREPKDFVSAIKALIDFDGVCVELDEGEIVHSTRQLAKHYGVFLEPSAGATYNGLTRLLAEDVVRSGEHVVLLGTGSGLKDPSVFSTEES
ncbi:pyridoxal-phosphate dependent enzyme [Paraburkholderia sp. IW21]|uniref:threonine synthase n=1 Tax=Paraburkholderia sp. IW21 TaxID=3242488 RepID=UPI003522F8BB